MLADLDLLLIAVFCTADDLLPEGRKNARRSVTDAEVVTLAVAPAMLKPSAPTRCPGGRGPSSQPSVPAAAPTAGYWKRRHRRPEPGHREQVLDPERPARAQTPRRSQPARPPSPHRQQTTRAPGRRLAQPPAPSPHPRLRRRLPLTEPRTTPSRAWAATPLPAPPQGWGAWATEIEPLPAGHGSAIHYSGWLGMGHVVSTAASKPRTLRSRSAAPPCRVPEAIRAVRALPISPSFSPGVEPAVRHLDIVSHPASVQCSIVPPARASRLGFVLRVIT